MFANAEEQPDRLDAVLAAPEHHVVLLENATTRVLETRIEPGVTVKLHTHRWPAVYYVLEAGDFVRRDAQGVVQVDTRAAASKPQAGQAVWAAPLGPHTLENVGSGAIHVISVEFKSAGSAEAGAGAPGPERS